jgi:hypothetical protein
MQPVYGRLFYFAGGVGKIPQLQPKPLHFEAAQNNFLSYVLCQLIKAIPETRQTFRAQNVLYPVDGYSQSFIAFIPMS